MDKNLPGNHWRRRKTIVLLDHGFNTISDKHFECCVLSRCRQRMRIFAEEQWATNTGLRPEFANGLGDGSNMQFVKRTVGGGATMSTGTEGHKLPRITHIRLSLKVLLH